MILSSATASSNLTPDKKQNRKTSAAHNTHMGENKTHNQTHPQTTIKTTPPLRHKETKTGGGGEPETTAVPVVSLTQSGARTTVPHPDRTRPECRPGRAHQTPISKQVTSKRGNQTNYTERLSVCGTCCHPAQETQTDASRHPFPCF